MQNPDRIDEYRQMHATSDDMFAGRSCFWHIRRIKSLIDETGAKNLLDFGSGKGFQYNTPLHIDGQDYDSVVDYWGVAIVCYDPAWEPFSEFPAGDLPFDAVISTDVLEHLSVDEINDVLDTLFVSASKFVYIGVSTEPAVKSLPSGRNCHETVRPADWWLGIVEAAVNAEDRDKAPMWVLACKGAQGESVYSYENWTPPPPYRFAAPGEELPPPQRPRIEIKTRNCIENDEILKQIDHAVDFAAKQGWKWLQKGRPNPHSAVVVSGGPSWTHYQYDLRTNMVDEFLFCVKSSHDWLIERDVVPYGCFLLDPRPLVGEYISEPHPEVVYLTASMCHPSVLEHLAEKNANVLMYHALVGAGEQNKYADQMLIAGGSTAATRGMNALRALGFRKFHCYGFDSCYDIDPSGTMSEYESAHRDEQHMRVDVVDGVVYPLEDGQEPVGRAFNTDPQLVAQVQDLKQFRDAAKECQVTYYGDGLGQHVMRDLQRRELKHPYFADIMWGAA